MPRPQFTLQALLILMLAVSCFFGGVRFERERRRREDDAAALGAKLKAKVARPFSPLTDPANMFDDPRPRINLYDDFEPGVPPASRVPGSEMR